MIPDASLGNAYCATISQFPSRLISIARCGNTCGSHVIRQVSPVSFSPIYPPMTNSYPNFTKFVKSALFLSRSDAVEIELLTGAPNRGPAGNVLTSMDPSHLSQSPAGGHGVRDGSEAMQSVVP
jgi:hypothetical protein